ncbi:IS30 family transposase [Humibacillus xanthopallidus]|uniref:IS30 family transposase n=1 Tax=Humibacillus xanthopallidus TaxID=412689 RepID=UPI00384B9A57
MVDCRGARQGRPPARREVWRGFWELTRAGASVEAAAAGVGITPTPAWRHFRKAGGVNPQLKPLSGRYLSFQERELISVWAAEKAGVREIARRLGRSPSTVSRELTRNARFAVPGPSAPPGTRPSPRPYLASVAQARAEARGRRPKPGKLASNPRLARYVQDKLGGPSRWSPEQISATLARTFAHDKTMQVSHETIYQALYVQGRGGLRRELASCLRTGRAVRRPNRDPGQRRTRVPDELLISNRPAEAADRAVPGHWEGDLIIGADSGSAIATLVERTTRYTMLLHLPGRHDAVAVRDAMSQAITALPSHLWRSLTWDQGSEMVGAHTEIRVATGLPIYFCDPHSPWQRGTNENTNGLLRQYFPKGTDLSTHTATDLLDVAAALNARPRKTLGWDTPAQALAKLLSTTNESRVATTP